MSFQYNWAMDVPKVFIYVGAETEEAWNRIADEIDKVLKSGRAGAGFRNGCVIGGSLETLLPRIMSAEDAAQLRKDERNVYILMLVRALSRSTAKKVGERIMGELGPDKLDEYFRQFKPAWHADAIDQVEARQRLEEVSRLPAPQT